MSSRIPDGVSAQLRSRPAAARRRRASLRRATTRGSTCRRGLSMRSGCGTITRTPRRRGGSTASLVRRSPTPTSSTPRRCGIWSPAPWTATRSASSPTDRRAAARRTRWRAGTRTQGSLPAPSQNSSASPRCAESKSSGGTRLVSRFARCTTRSYEICSPRMLASLTSASGRFGSTPTTTRPTCPSSRCTRTSSRWRTLRKRCRSGKRTEKRAART
mmetsp:Transcript_13623/g.33519  ORF Transcript_13623/g.33519 Transcript_13623/m.33519 type:complete len:216 (-) Transcript_13623:76-723(-)